MCGRLEGAWRKAPPARVVSRFGTLYRSTCADLALADAYQLPPTTIQYLHQLVGRAHNQLYRAQTFQVRSWYRELFVNVPQRLFADNCLRLAFVLFWSVFLLCMYLSWRNPDFAEQAVGKELLVQMESMYSREAIHDRADASAGMSGYYISHNGTIGLRCFAYGVLAGIGGIYETIFNAAVLGAVFGHMMDDHYRTHFVHFVTAHGPFELTAIVLMAAAGMRLGFSLVNTGGRGRGDALFHAARRSVPVMAAGVVLLALAAGIESFISPSSLPYAVKAGVAIVSTAILLFYFVVLGYPGQRDEEAAR